jgi:hypothetical protein
MVADASSMFNSAPPFGDSRTTEWRRRAPRTGLKSLPRAMRLAPFPYESLVRPNVGTGDHSGRGRWDSYPVNGRAGVLALARPGAPPGRPVLKASN